MVTIPTIDQISGSTVMRKMRDLINHFITFAGEVDDELTTLDNKFDGYYTKVEVDADFPTFTYLSTNYYNKGETDSLVADITKHINALKPLYVWESSQTPGDWRISLLYTEKFKQLSNGTLDINTDGTSIKENSLTHQLYVDSQALAGDGLSGGVSPNVLDVKVDGTSIGFNEDGELESLVEGATYTAGNGITIDDNVISLDNEWESVTYNSYAAIKNDLPTYDILYIYQDTGKDVLYTELSFKNVTFTNYGFICPLYINPSSQTNKFGFLHFDSSAVTVVSIPYFVKHSTYSLNMFKFMDMDGTLIDSTTLSNYIDSNNNIIKPIMYSFIENNGIYSGGGLIPIITGTSDSATRRIRLTLHDFMYVSIVVTQIKLYINAGQTGSSYKPESVIKLNTNNINIDYANYSDTHNKFYRRKKI